VYPLTAPKRNGQSGLGAIRKDPRQIPNVVTLQPQRNEYLRRGYERSAWAGLLDSSDWE